MLSVGCCSGPWSVVMLLFYYHYPLFINHVSPQLDMMSEQTPDEFICEYESSACCVVRVWDLTVVTVEVWVCCRVWGLWPVPWLGVSRVGTTGDRPGLLCPQPGPVSQWFTSMIRVFVTLIAQLLLPHFFSLQSSQSLCYSMTKKLKSGWSLWSILPPYCPLSVSGHLCQTVWRSDGPLTARKGCLSCIGWSREHALAPLRPRGSPALRMKERFPLRCGLINA